MTTLGHLHPDDLAELCRAREAGDRLVRFSYVKEALEEIIPHEVHRLRGIIARAVAVVDGEGRTYSEVIEDTLTILKEAGP